MLLRSVIGRGVVAIVRMLEPVIVNVKCALESHILPAGSGRGHVGIKPWHVHCCDKE